ncbi:hypothetical protein MSAN_00973800 [Mycena sanguinolenta]|uniref:Uncharacterized protein n=1 Tax=Mycena sanguinolenta TaxID=230812 RepID=A0A8H6YYI5_9AGAR|nr:hypothetical protein MSAN_00973800 [Mycena sanguinolenta]
MRCRLSVPLSLRIHAVSLLFLTRVLLSIAKPCASPRDISGRLNPPMRGSEHVALSPWPLDFESITEYSTIARAIPRSRRDHISRRRERRRPAADDPTTTESREIEIPNETDPFSVLNSILSSILGDPPTATEPFTIPTESSSFSPTSPSVSTSTPPPPVSPTSTSDSINTSFRSSISSLSPPLTQSSTTPSGSIVLTTFSHESSSPSSLSSSTPHTTPSSASSLLPSSISSASLSLSSFSSSTSTPISASVSKSESRSTSIVVGTIIPLLVFALLGGTVMALRRRRRLNPEGHADANADTSAPDEQGFARTDAGGEESAHAGSVVLLLGPAEKDSGNPSPQASNLDRAQNASETSLPLSAAPHTTPHSPSPSPSPIPFPVQHAASDPEQETSKTDNSDSDASAADPSRSRSRAPTYKTIGSEESVDRTPPTPLPRYTTVRPLPTIPFVRAS